MARYTGPKHKLCRAEGIALCNSPKCPVIRKNAGGPGQHGPKGRKKLSEYGVQLREKQKAKRMYGVLERQFKKYFDRAAAKRTATGAALLEILETRLDNVVYKLNFAASRQQARQLVSHGHIMVGGKRMTIPSYNVKIGDIITLSEKAANFGFIKKLAQDEKDKTRPSWLNRKALVGIVESLPKREEIKDDINEQLIVEYYSR